MKMMIRTFKKDNLTVKIYNSRDNLGRESGAEAGDRIKDLLKNQPFINIIFAAAPSQNEFLENLVGYEGIDWSRINAFHMDEYIGLSRDAPQGFGNFLKAGIFNLKPFHAVSLLDGLCDATETECQRYSQLLTEYPADIVLMGIGENGHIAFNDPHVANFMDKDQVKVVELDCMCRQQQVNDGCFSAIEKVPTHALTVTIPSLLKAKYIFCMVPGLNKAKAVANTIEKEISERYPSTILRTHKSAILYLDDHSSRLLK